MRDIFFLKNLSGRNIHLCEIYLAFLIIFIPYIADAQIVKDTAYVTLRRISPTEMRTDTVLFWPLDMNYVVTEGPNTPYHGTWFYAWGNPPAAVEDWKLGFDNIPEERKVQYLGTNYQQYFNNNGTPDGDWEVWYIENINLPGNDDDTTLPVNPDSLIYFVFYPNSAQNFSDTVEVHPYYGNTITSDDPLQQQHQDQWISWSYQSPTSDLDDLWSGFDNLSENVKQSIIPNYTQYRNNLPLHQPDLDGEIVLVKYLDQSANDDIPLPVTMIPSSFRGIYLANQDAVKVTWETASELNNDHFELYRQTLDNQNNPKGPESLVEIVQGLGTSSVGKKYEVIDNNLPETGDDDRLKYILWQQDIDGTRENLGSFSIDPDQGFVPDKYVFNNPFPNPTNGQAMIRYTLGDVTKLTLGLYDTDGERVRKQTKVINPGPHSDIISLDGLASGTYFLQINAEGSAGSKYQNSFKIILVK